jgi:hypothetical protein
MWGVCPYGESKRIDDRESLAIPVDHLLAMVMDSNETTGIVQTLNHTVSLQSIWAF